MPVDDYNSTDSVCVCVCVSTKNGVIPVLRNINCCIFSQNFHCCMFRADFYLAKIYCIDATTAHTHDVDM